MFFAGRVLPDGGFHALEKFRDFLFRQRLAGMLVVPDGSNLGLRASAVAQREQFVFGGAKAVVGVCVSPVQDVVLFASHGLFADAQVRAEFRAVQSLCQDAGCFQAGGAKAHGRSLRSLRRRARPCDLHSHSGAQVRSAFAAELRGDTVAVTGRIDHRADFHDRRTERAFGIADEGEFDFGATCRTALGRFRNLELNLKRGELADSEAFVAFGNLLAFANIADDDGSGERGAQTGLVELDFEALDFFLAALGVCFPAMQVVFGAFGFEVGLFEIGLAGKAGLIEFLLTVERSRFGPYLRLLVLHVVLSDLKIILSFGKLNLQGAIVELGEDVALLYFAAFVARD